MANPKTREDAKVAVTDILQPDPLPATIASLGLTQVVANSHIQDTDIQLRTVADETARLALDAVVGMTRYQIDDGKVYVCTQFV